MQPSEFVKIIYVFFIASLLAKRTDFKSVAVISIAAAVHVGILVLEKDLGAALIYFVTYLMMLYVATMKLRYLAAGAFAGTAASEHRHEQKNTCRVPDQSRDTGLVLKSHL